jgi:nucleotide-binding universal stress UspA family protein
VVRQKERRLILFEKILFATDGSRQADKIFPFIISLAKKFKIEVFILYCTPHSILKLTSAASFTPVTTESGVGLSRGAIVPSNFEIPEKEKEKAKNIVGRTQEILKNSGVSSIPLIGYGHPGKIICQTAQKQKIDLVMVGQKGGGKIKDYSLGSTAYYVTRHAPCTVLIVK